jgi:NAD(P)-dependent dehydrogenase (short-subunit alcohol dehydrogenase family)
MHVVIMGGTSGIGLATAERLTAAGAKVMVTGRDPEKVAAVNGQAIEAARVDGASKEEVSVFFGRVGPFDHLVLAFSPGAVGLGELRDTALEEIEAAFAGKLFPYLFAIQQAQVLGSITLISAATARSGLRGTVGLAAVNGAIERIVSPLAAEFAPVRVNAVAPGAIDTPWWSFLAEEERQSQFESMAKGLPAGRVGRAEEVAEAIRYLIDRAT